MDPKTFGSVEIERKFVISKKRFDEIMANEGKTRQLKSIAISRSGYFPIDKNSDISQMRVSLTNTKCRINIKGKLNGCSRGELSETISPSLAERLYNIAPYRLFRKRYHIEDDEGIEWCLDQLMERFYGIYLCEVEVPYESYPLSMQYANPRNEITKDPRLYYESLARTTGENEVREIFDLYNIILNLGGEE